MAAEEVRLNDGEGTDGHMIVDTVTEVPCEEHEGCTVVTVSVDLRNRQFHGTRIAFSSTHEQGQARWTELRLYATPHEDSKYVLINSGCSVYYHQTGGQCNTGVPRLIMDLSDQEYQDLTPCPVCKPLDLDYLDQEGTVNAEVTRNGIKRLVSAGDLVNQLMFRPRTGGDPYLPQPASRLLRIAADPHGSNDEEIWGAITQTRDL